MNNTTTTRPAVAASAVEINTSRFEFSHGRKPTGHGWWIFEHIGGNAKFEIRNANFGKAKAAAKKHFAALGLRSISVAP